MYVLKNIESNVKLYIVHYKNIKNEDNIHVMEILMI